MTKSGGCCGKDVYPLSLSIFVSYLSGCAFCEMLCMGTELFPRWECELFDAFPATFHFQPLISLQSFDFEIRYMCLNDACL